MRLELADPAYNAEPPLLQRIVEWVLEHVANRSPARQVPSLRAGRPGRPARTAGTGLPVVLRRTGLPARRARTGGVLFGTRRRSAAEHRADADVASARNDWRVAVVERYRAVVAELEERGVIDPRARPDGRRGGRRRRRRSARGRRRPGRGARLFDAVHYGNRPASADNDATLRRLDDAARAARPRHSPPPVGTGLAVPS